MEAVNGFPAMAIVHLADGSVIQSSSTTVAPPGCLTKPSATIFLKVKPYAVELTTPAHSPFL